MLLAGYGLGGMQGPHQTSRGDPGGQTAPRPDCTVGELASFRGTMVECTLAGAAKVKVGYFLIVRLRSKF